MFLLAGVVEKGDQDGAIAQVVYSLPVFFCEAFLAKELVYCLFVRLLVCVIWGGGHRDNRQDQFKLCHTNFWLEVFRVLTRVFKWLVVV